MLDKSSSPRMENALKRTIIALFAVLALALGISAAPVQAQPAAASTFVFYNSTKSDAVVMVYAGFKCKGWWDIVPRGGTSELILTSSFYLPKHFQLFQNGVRTHKEKPYGRCINLYAYTPGTDVRIDRV